MLAASNIWIADDEANTAKIEFCHVLKLINPVTEFSKELVIAEDRRNILIDVSLMAGFNLTTALKGEYGIRMTFLGEMSINNFSPSTPEEEAKAIDAITASVSKHAEEGLEAGQDMYNVTVLSFEVNSTQRITSVTTQLVLEEGCRNVTACKDLVGTTTMYDDVTGHMKHKFEDGGFVATLNALYVFRRYLLSKLSSFQDSSPSSSSSPPLHRMVQEGEVEQDQGPITVDANFTKPDTLEIEVIMPVLDISYVSADVNVDSYVEACKCDGVQSFTCDESALPPNGELVVCIWSKSRDVEVDFLNSLVLNQGGTSFHVVKLNEVEYPSISSKEHVPIENGVAVSTRVPSNLFTFATGRSITISGEIKMKLYGEERRRRQLLALTSDASFEEESSFGFNVKLSSEVDSAEEVGPLTTMGVAANPATVGSQSIALMGVFGSLIYSFYW